MKNLAMIMMLLALVACTPAEEVAEAENTARAVPATETVADAEDATEGEEAATQDEASSTESSDEGEEEAEVVEKDASYYVDKVVELHTGEGVIAIRFYPDVAPNHVKNFIDLSESGFYDGVKFHRIMPGFVIQGGDPNTKSGDPSTWGTGGSGTKLKAEFNSVHHARGILSMARSADPDSASSQFFVCHADAGSLDNQYTVFGAVSSGMDVVDKIASGERTGPRNDLAVNPVVIEKAVIREANDDEKGPAPQ